MKAASPIILLFDGVCAFCGGWVTFLLPRDHKKLIRFAALQTEAGQAILKKHGLPLEDFNTMLVVEGQGEQERLYSESSGVREVLRRLGPGWRFVGALLGAIPKFIRDPAYRLVARNRYRWFGKNDQCFLPSSETRSRFL